MKAGEAIESGLLTRQIERAQRRVEQHNFDARKQLLEYDDVANDQRRVIYQQRTDLMAAEDVSEAIVGMREEVAGQLVDQYVPGGAPEDQLDVPGLAQALERDFGVILPVAEWVAQEEGGDGTKLRGKIVAGLEKAYALKEASVGTQVLRYIEKEVTLRTLDQHWREHLAAMDYMRQGIHLRSYAQKNPKQEYKREAFELFAQLIDIVKTEVTKVLLTVRVQTQEQVAQATEAIEASAEHVGNVQYTHPNDDGSVSEETGPLSLGAAAAAAAGAAGTTVPRVGRNDPCPCGSGLRYKECHGKLA
jgi:preprotein translocase subunit SecA